jgi:hypothetical protein
MVLSCLIGIAVWAGLHLATRVSDQTVPCCRYSSSGVYFAPNAENVEVCQNVDHGTFWSNLNQLEPTWTMWFMWDHVGHVIVLDLYPDPLSIGMRGIPHATQHTLQRISWSTSRVCRVVLTSESWNRQDVLIFVGTFWYSETVWDQGCTQCQKLLVSMIIESR